jgi:ubiquinone/menaquinone biosynthesis C-methylase UbiE
MSFTGERYMPGEGGAQIAYEHMHRYIFALRWAEGKQVLDLACGNGYGAALLARQARHVWAIDLDEETLVSAGRDWYRENITFIRSDAGQLPFCDGSMGLVVAMEALEHIQDQEQLVREMARVCSVNGIVLISTPNKAAYSDARHYVNPFHIRELYLDEFMRLLDQHFPYVYIASQQVKSGSLITCKTNEFLSEVVAEPVPGLGNVETAPMYFIAVCSMDELREPVPAHSAYLDLADGLIREGKEEIGRLNEEIERLGRWAHSLENAIREKDQQIRDLQRRTEEEVGQRDQAIRNLQKQMGEEVGRRDQQVIELLNSLHRKEKEFDERGRWALGLQEEVEALTKIRRMLLYRVLAKIGLLPK